MIVPRKYRRASNDPVSGLPIKACSNCQQLHDRNGRYCVPCHNEYMRDWRRGRYVEYDHKVRARDIARVAKHRGKLQPKPCQQCGSEQNLEMHHMDYSKPKDVTWLCRECHRAWHKTFGILAA